jgi:hypothetical protein
VKHEQPPLRDASLAIERRQSACAHQSLRLEEDRHPNEMNKSINNSRIVINDSS